MPCESLDGLSGNWDPFRGTRRLPRVNRRVPLSEFQFPERPSKDSQDIWHPSPYEKQDTT